MIATWIKYPCLNVQANPDNSDRNKWEIELHFKGQPKATINAPILHKTLYVLPVLHVG